MNQYSHRLHHFNASAFLIGIIFWLLAIYGVLMLTGCAVRHIEGTHVPETQGKDIPWTCAPQPCAERPQFSNGTLYIWSKPR